MKTGRNFWEHILEQSTLSPEAVPGQSIVEIAGDRRVLVENHLGVAAYGSEQILVNVTFGSICICGCNLELMHMTKDRLIIYGRIDSVKLQRRR